MPATRTKGWVATIPLAPGCLDVCNTKVAATWSNQPRFHNSAILSSESILVNMRIRQEKFEQSYSSTDERRWDEWQLLNSFLFRRVSMHRLTKTCGVRLHTRWYRVQVEASIALKSFARWSSSRRQHFVASLVVRFPANNTQRSSITAEGNWEGLFESSLSGNVCSRTMYKKSFGPICATSGCKTLEQCLQMSVKNVLTPSVSGTREHRSNSDTTNLLKESRLILSLLFNSALSSESRQHRLDFGAATNNIAMLSFSTKFR